MYCAKTAEPIEMPFGGLTQVGPRNHVLDRGSTSSSGRVNFGGYPANWKALWVSAAVYAAKGIIQATIAAWHAMRPFVKVLLPLVCCYQAGACQHWMLLHFTWLDFNQSCIYARVTRILLYNNNLGTSADHLNINKIIFNCLNRKIKTQKLTNDVDLSAGGVHDDVIRQGQRPITGRDRRIIY